MATRSASCNPGSSEEGRALPRSGYIARLRREVGHGLLLVPSVTLCIFDDADRLLLLRHDDGDVWAPPGGTIEPGDTPATAAAREAWEEMRLRIRPRHVIGVYGGPGFEVRYDNGDVTSYVMTVFECDALAGPLELDGVEVHEARYVSEDELRDLETPSWLEQVAPDVFDWRRSGGGPARFAPSHHAGEQQGRR